MSAFDFNKIIAAIIIAIIVVVIIDKVGNIIINPDKNKLQETAYKIDITKSDDNLAVSKALTDNIAIDSISGLLASSSLENGEKIYKKCGSCHNYKKDSKSKIGPSLWNIINQPKGNATGFAYSKALIEFGGNWNYEELNNFLYNPKEYIKGTKMNFVGLKKNQDRADLILWLRQLSDNPIPLP